MRHTSRTREPETSGDLTQLPPPEWLHPRNRRAGGAPQGILAAFDQERFAAYVVHADVFVVAPKARARQPLLDDKGFVRPL